jgi:redox-sensitive bicupin YhaK (pirin superfamily)
MRPVQVFQVVPSLPAPLEGLRQLAYNLRWAWDHDTVALFRRLDADTLAHGVTAAGTEATAAIGARFGADVLAADGSVKIHQDARVYAAVLDSGDVVTYSLPQGRKAYVHVARGVVELNDNALSSGDGAKVSGEQELRLSGGKAAEVLLFDLPAGE